MADIVPSMVDGGNRRTVHAVVDGLNLYHGMKDADLSKYRWLDVVSMVELLLQDLSVHTGIGHDLTGVHYCTSYVVRPQSERRQDLYLQALAAHRPPPLLEMLFGKYEPTTREGACANCKQPVAVSIDKEKRTDVNIAVQMLKAAIRPAEIRPDTILLVTGDSDLIPAVEAVRELDVHVVVAAPPARHHDRLQLVATNYMRVGRRHVKFSPLPEIVTRPDTGYVLSVPNGWDPPSTW